MAEEDKNWVHINEIARSYNISTGTVSKWWKEAPDDQKRRMANLKLLHRRYALMRIAQMKVALLQRAVQLPAKPFIKIVDDPSEEPSPNAIAAAARKEFPEYPWMEDQ